MSRRNQGIIQLGDLTHDATWSQTESLLLIRFLTASFTHADWHEVEHLREYAEPVFLFWDGTANSDNHIIGFDRDATSVTFYLSDARLKSYQRA
jgi:hypothetical protein